MLPPHADRHHCLGGNKKAGKASGGNILTRFFYQMWYNEIEKRRCANNVPLVASFKTMALELNHFKK